MKKLTEWIVDEGYILRWEAANELNDASDMFKILMAYTEYQADCFNKLTSRLRYATTPTPKEPDHE